ncbi:hypothetical protein G6O67_007596 [Ophiocordyceps sinensis]|uniref:Zinc finger, FYVE domain containing protein n=1 Tax=Ophiocordyceps sinensis TaxID=72228 RepID=A0A8H4PLC3_9HYPO|nr:hypothetical protein G6O67_007596 [Ophiocordyceps sinensis]
MADDVEKSLLGRLQALRASSATPERPVRVHVIERAKTPTRHDALATRLKRLRDGDGPCSSPSSAASPPANESSAARERSRRQELGNDCDSDDDAAQALFRTDDDTLEELLGAHLDDQPSGHGASPIPPGDDEVKALLEELAAAIPKHGQEGAKTTGWGKDGDSDDSDGEQMAEETDHVVARFQDEVELDTALRQGQPRDAPHLGGEEEEEEEADADLHAQQHPDDNPPPSSCPVLPSLPSDLPSLPSTSTTLLPAATSSDDMAARMAALRVSSSSPSPSFPSVPTSRPSSPAAGPRRLTSRTAYTDDDADSWCTVCLADATLRCLGCDHDAYCARCWWEMHLGPSAGFGEGSHKAVQFTDERDKEKRKIALGAS